MLKVNTPLLVTILVVAAYSAPLACANLPAAPTKPESITLTTLDKELDQAMPRVLRGAFNATTVACLGAGFINMTKDVYAGNTGTGCLKMAGGLGAAAASHTLKGIVTETDFKKTVSAVLVNFDIARIITACTQSYLAIREARRTDEQPGSPSSNTSSR